ncbi:MAG: AbrB/MazE/SpoVT family DNA-binding domain-containing protein [Lautropia sp.]|nr:AbrB/MazE/SpoVT family DNA-binding domain-containing protein [Lautropia sp.]
MDRTAKLFTTGGSQAVRLPAEFRFDAGKVYIWKDELTGNVTLSLNPRASWHSFASLRDKLSLSPEEQLPAREQGTAETRDPFSD